MKGHQIKFVSIICSVMLFASVLAGCGSSNNNSGAAPSEKPSGTNQNANTNDLSGEITVWSSSDDMKNFVTGFNVKYPNIKVNLTIIPNDQFEAKIKPALQSGQGAPDIFTGESDYVKNWVETSFWEDLTAEPYNIGQYTDGMWKYVVDVGTDAAGKIRALSWQASPGSIIYRKDMAKQYLGTDDAEELSKMMSTQEGMMNVAKTLKEKSDGKIKMFASWKDLYNMQFSNRTQPWVVDGKLVMEDTMIDFYDQVKEISDNGYDLNADPWSPAWIAAVNGQDAFSYVLPTWGLQYVILPNAEATKGQWGLASGPIAYSKGGTWLGMWSGSKKKDLAWEFLKYVTVDEDSLTTYAKEHGEYVSNKAADASLASEPGNEVLGGQNHYQFYNSQMDKITTGLMTGMDQQINNAYLLSVEQYKSNKLTKEQAIEQFKKDVNTAYPDIDTK